MLSEAPRHDGSAWTDFMANALQRASTGSTLEVRGTLTHLAGLVLEATGLQVPVGSQCRVCMPEQPPVLAEVVGFAGRPRVPDAGRAMCTACRAAPAWCRRRPMCRCRAWAMAPSRRLCRSRACCGCPWAMACWDGWSTPRACRWTTRAR